MIANSPWNANIHYHPVLLSALPNRAQRVLDVGCGDGILCAQLAEAGVRHIVGLDADPGVLDRARARHQDLPIEWIHGDIFDITFAEPFDAVLSVATLHHADSAKGLARLAQFVRPGGIVGVIGLAANNWWDLPYAAIGEGAKLALGFIHGYWEHSAPMTWPPAVTYQQIKRIARNVLPGVRYKRHLLGRYSLIWENVGAVNRDNTANQPDLA